MSGSSRLATDPAYLAHAIASLRVATGAEPIEYMDTAPYPGPANPMSDETAAWIRERVWTNGMRKLFAAAPSSYLNCACQSGIAYSCNNGQHNRCARGEPLRQQETAVRLSDGMRPAIGASDVWLADRVCVWRCKCSCHTSSETAEEPTPATPAPQPSKPRATGPVR